MILYFTNILKNRQLPWLDLDLNFWLIYLWNINIRSNWNNFKEKDQLRTVYVNIVFSTSFMSINVTNKHTFPFYRCVKNALYQKVIFGISLKIARLFRIDITSFIIILPVIVSSKFYAHYLNENLNVFIIHRVLLLAWFVFIFFI